MIEQWFSGKKTYLLAIAGFVGALTAASQGMIPWDDATLGMWMSGLAASLRGGISKNGGAK